MMLDFFYTHKKKIVISFLVLILVCIIIYYLNIDWGHSVLYNNYDYFYANKTKMVGYEKIKDSSNGIQYSYSLFLN